MTINNTEYDLDLLLQKHGPNVIDSARELRAATGVTLKDAMNIIDTYQKDGILPKTGSAEPRRSGHPADHWHGQNCSKAPPSASPFPVCYVLIRKEDRRLLTAFETLSRSPHALRHTPVHYGTV